jgi:pimeloyl-ACP methyl ester carboxylesterase
MFEYFRTNYTWNLATMMTLGMGGQMSEIDEACRALRQVSDRPDSAALEDWHQAWARLSERIAALAEEDAKEGFDFSAGGKYLRATAYAMTSERMMGHKDHRRLAVYKRMLDLFRKGAVLRSEPVEWVEIPYKDTSLPALFVKANGDAPAPCMIHFDGLDVMKELLYLSQLPAEFRRRGVSTLIVDHPGVGEALRLRNLKTLPETEVPARAAIDYLQTRSDVDPQCIGIIALSLGGYYAPRAAAFENRLKCCVAWGAIWDWWELRGKRGLNSSGEPSVSNFGEHVAWVFGVDTFEQAMEIAKRFSLVDIIDRITCPLLVVHGANDRQVPLWTAEKTYAGAVNSPNRKLKVFSLAEGGSEHCSVDNWSINHDYIANWVASVLGGRNRPGAR